MKSNQRIVKDPPEDGGIYNRQTPTKKEIYLALIELHPDEIKEVMTAVVKKTRKSKKNISHQ